MKMPFKMLSVILALFVHSAYAETTVDEVEATLQAKQKELKGLSAKVTSKTVMEVPGYSMRTTMEGTYQMMTVDGKTRFVQKSKSTAETDIGGNKSSTRSEDLSLSNGTDMYNVSKSDAGNTAYHSVVAKPTDTKEAKPFDAMREMFELKVLADEKVNGRDCFALESRMKDPAMAAMSGRSVYYYDKATGFMVKMVAFNAEDKPTTTMEYTDIEINPELSEDLFKWDPAMANGAELQEMG